MKKIIIPAIATALFTFTMCGCGQATNNASIEDKVELQPVEVTATVSENYTKEIKALKKEIKELQKKVDKNTGEGVEWVECGSCGAHVHDWWTIRNMKDTEWVEICEFCYQNVLDNETIK